jgi:5-methylcytosine-specific restriction endonuclease McrA
MKHIIHNDDVHIKSYAHLVLLNKVYSTMESKRWNRARDAFLKQEIRTKGCLICSYCGKANLKLKTNKRGEQATVDHYIPKSGGGDPFSSSNFVVCCHSCNQKKASMTPEKFINSDYIKKKRLDKI